MMMWLQRVNSLFLLVSLCMLCMSTQWRMSLSQPSASGNNALSFLHAMNPADLFVDSKEASSYFESLSEEELQKHWSHSEGLPLVQQAAQLTDTLDMHNNGLRVHIDVVLVGFAGDGNMELRLPASTFERFFEGGVSSKQQSYFAMEYIYNVVMPKTSMQAQRVAEVVQDEVRRTTLDKHAGLVRVPRARIDEVITEYQRTRAGKESAYTIYLLNPRVPTDTNGKRVRYTYTTDDQGESTCGSNLWLGKDQRVVWVDLSAVIETFGPRESGTGVVTKYSLPDLERLYARDTLVLRNTLIVTGTIRIGGNDPDAVPMNAHEAPMFEARTQLLLGEVFDLIRRIASQVVTPSIDVFPVDYVRRTRVEVLVVHTDPNWHELQHNPTQSWTDMGKQLKRLELAGQSIELSEQHVRFQECSECMQGWTHARRVGYAGSGAYAEETVFLDSTTLTDWVEHIHDSSSKAPPPLHRNTHHEHPSYETSQRIIRVVVFEQPTAMFALLDGHRAAVATTDVDGNHLVLAVQTSQIGLRDSGLDCEDRRVSVPTQDSSRAVLGEMLRAVFGVGAASQTWNPYLNITEQDFTFGIDDFTPFGAGSRNAELSVFHIDAAQRNVIQSELYRLKLYIQDIFKHYAHVESRSGQMDTTWRSSDVLDEEGHLMFVRRVNLLKFKLERCVEIMMHPLEGVSSSSEGSGFKFAMAYVNSAKHDLHSLHEMVTQSTKALHASLHCADVNEFHVQSSVSFLVEIAALCGTVLLLAAWILYPSQLWKCFERILRPQAKRRVM